jgi:hypothetical protein
VNVHAKSCLTPEALRTLRSEVEAALGHRGLVVPVRPPGRTGTRLAHGTLLPTGPGPRGDQTFGQWLAEYAQSRRLAEGVGVASRQP